MKRIITLVLLALVTLAAQAQFWVGGSMYIDRTKEISSSLDIDRKTSFILRLIPEVGYHLTDKVGLGISAGYEFNSQHIVLKNTNQPFYDRKNYSNSYYLTPFVRYYFNSNRFRLFADGELPFNTNHNQGNDETSFSMGLALRPGVQFEICSRMGLQCYLGALTYNHQWYGNNNADSFTFNLKDQIYLGVYFNL